MPIDNLAGRFRGAKTFVEDSSKQFTLFYQDVGQHLSKWVAHAPKIKETEPKEPEIPTIFSSSSEVVQPSNEGVSVPPNEPGAALPSLPSFGPPSESA